MSSTEAPLAESGHGPADRRRLLEIAEASIDRGLREGLALDVDPSGESEALRETRACFVTLRRCTRLRGCIGTLEPERPLACDVARNAFLAAFRDPRFAPLVPDERDDLEIHLSVLGPRTPIAAASEDELIGALRPGIDGLVLSDGSRRATFLPAVWESLPDRRRFVAELKRKAGLPERYWSSSISFERYVTESFP